MHFYGINSQKNVFSNFSTHFALKFWPVSETNHRTIGDDNGTIEQLKDFMGFLSFSYDKRYAYQVSTFRLSSFRRYGGGGVTI